MAMGMMKPGGRGRRRGRSHRLNSEINVTPFVDVMLVLLIVFMVSAPLLTVGIPVNLPKAAAPTLTKPEEPVSVSIDSDGQWYVGDRPVEGDFALIDALETATDGDKERKIFLRGDTALAYGDVMTVMATVTNAGYTKLALISRVSESQ